MRYASKKKGEKTHCLGEKGKLGKGEGASDNALSGN